MGTPAWQAATSEAQRECLAVPQQQHAAQGRLNSTPLHGLIDSTHCVLCEFCPVWKVLSLSTMAEPFFGRRKTVWEAVKEQLKPPEVTEVENVIGLQLLNEIEVRTENPGSPEGIALTTR